MQLLQKPIKLCEGLSFGDRRLLVHLVDVLKNGRSSCVVHTVDTDVIIILIGKFFSSINYHKSFARFCTPVSMDSLDHKAVAWLGVCSMHPH